MKKSTCFILLLIGLMMGVLSNQQTSAQVQWNKYSANPVLGYSLSKGESVIQSYVMEDQGLLRMWYTRRDMDWNFTVGEALSFDGTRWYDLIGAPVLKAGSIGSFDGIGIAKPCVIRDNEGYKMYYTGQGSSINKIGMATSTDGHTWTRSPNNPVIEPDLSIDWEKAGTWAPVVLHEDSSTYEMWYQGYNGTYASVGYATSSDGVHWSKYSGNPVLSHGTAGEFDYLTAGEPNVIRVGNRYHMFYTSSDINLYNKIGYAYSQDGIHWTKYKNNPVLDASPYGNWDGKLVAAPSVIFKNNQFHMWYTGVLSGSSRDIGYATAPVDSLLMTVFTPANNLPDQFELLSNYPNPFNPSTLIQFGIPEPGKVKITIFDVLGREVKTIFNHDVDPHWYEVSWDGTNKNGAKVASGTYYYRAEFFSMTTNQTARVKKMNLIK